MKILESNMIIHRNGEEITLIITAPASKIENDPVSHLIFPVSAYDNTGKEIFLTCREEAEAFKILIQERKKS